MFLDLRRDRYFRLGDVGAALLDQLCASPESLLPREADKLCANGLFVPAEAPEQICPTKAPEITSSLLEAEVAGRARLRLLPKLATILARTRSALKRGRLAELVDETRQGQARLPTAGGAALGLARDFCSVRPLLPIAPNCLLDSLSLEALLRSRGIRADLVFGVKLEPFGAHCWVQEGGTVLNDSVGNACDFTPILVA